MSKSDNCCCKCRFWFETEKRRVVKSRRTPVTLPRMLDRGRRCIVFLGCHGTFVHSVLLSCRVSQGRGTFTEGRRKAAAVAARCTARIVAAYEGPTLTRMVGGRCGHQYVVRLRQQRRRVQTTSATRRFLSRCPPFLHPAKIETDDFCSMSYSGRLTYYCAQYAQKSR